MTAHNATVNYFTDWEITPEGNFRNKTSGNVLSLKDWEVEMSYEHYDNDDALAFAKVLADQAERVAQGNK